jgi:hypothetical protein
MFLYSNLIVFDPANIASLMNIEMLQYQVNVVPNNGYAITDLAVLLGMVLFRSGILCIAPVNGGHINGIIVNNILHTVDPNLISSICYIFLG